MYLEVRNSKIKICFKILLLFINSKNIWTDWSLDIRSLLARPFYLYFPTKNLNANLHSSLLLFVVVAEHPTWMFSKQLQSDGCVLDLKAAAVCTYPIPSRGVTFSLTLSTQQICTHKHFLIFLHGVFGSCRGIISTHHFSAKLSTTKSKMTAKLMLCGAFVCVRMLFLSVHNNTHTQYIT